MLEWEILGCGGSMGVPMIGCDCAVCTSADPLNQRCRTAALIRSATTTVLIDAGPDLRFQALRAGIRQIDAVLITHPHQDHIAGVDDLRPWSFKLKSLPVYGNALSLQRLRHQYDYAFAVEESASTRPQMDLHEIDAAPFTVGDIDITPLPIWHGDWSIRGFRAGAVAYLTDVKTIPETTYPLLENLDTLIIGALRFAPTHPLHMSIAEALEAIERIRPRQALLVHLAHDLDYAATNAQLPPHVRLAHDGLIIRDPGSAASF